MSIVPNGFTPIAPNYLPLDPPPSTTGLEGSNEILLANGVVSLTSLTGVTQETQTTVVEAESLRDWLITATPNQTYLYPGELLQLKCKLTPPALASGNSRSIRGSLLARLLTAPSSLTGFPQTAFVSSLDVNGECTFLLPVGQTAPDTAQSLTWVVQASETDNAPSLLISQAEYASAVLVSTPVRITVVPNAENPDTLAVTQIPPTPPSVPVIPLHDVAVTALGTQFRTYTIEETLDLSSINQQPRGSSGPGIYSDLGIPSPASASMHQATPLDAVQRLLGMASDQLKRLQGWATKILHLAHSLESADPRSEVNLLMAVLPPELRSSIERYSSFVEQAGRFASDTAASYIPDYAQGNTLIESNAVEQHNVGQYRVQSTSVFDVNAPSINIAAQQSVTQVRFEHHVNDLYQGSHAQAWIRAEDQFTLIGGNTARYNTAELAEYSANSTVASGLHFQYADTVWNQVGQITNIPLHPLRSRSIGNYGRSINVTQLSHHVQCLQGDINLQSSLGMRLTSLTEGVSLTAPAGIISAHGVQMSLLADAQMGLYSAAGTTVASAGGVHLASVAPVTINGSIVLINSGQAGMQIPAIPVPIILNYIPKIMLPMQDPAPYPREAPVTTGQVAQRAGQTPSASSTPSSTTVGSLLTGSYPPKSAKSTPSTSQ